MLSILSFIVVSSSVDIGSVVPSICKFAVFVAPVYVNTSSSFTLNVSVPTAPTSPLVVGSITNCTLEFVSPIIVPSKFISIVYLTTESSLVSNPVNTNLT